MAANLAGYLTSCFLLLVPVLIWNAGLARHLPPGYSAGGPWDRVPRALSAVENALRAVVLLMPLLLRLGASSAGQRVGLGLYVAGLIAYAASWLAQIRAPDSAWSRSRLGFLAPAYTAGIWLTGIGLIGERLVIELPYRPWIYLSAIGVFSIVHTAHAYQAYELGRSAAGLGRARSG